MEIGRWSGAIKTGRRPCVLPTLVAVEASRYKLCVTLDEFRPQRLAAGVTVESHHLSVVIGLQRLAFAVWQRFDIDLDAPEFGVARISR